MIDQRGGFEHRYEVHLRILELSLVVLQGDDLLLKLHPFVDYRVVEVGVAGF